MLQVLQNIGTGETILADVAVPQIRPGTLLIQTQASLISAGTERMLIEFGKGNWLAKARQQPDKVREVLNKINTDGLFATIDAVRSKLDLPLPLGYCNAGVVVEVGSGVDTFRVGDRVVSNGYHAEMVNVPVNLCAKIPKEVTYEAAAYTVLGAIALQGIRLAQPSLGEAFVVIGLGLIGLLAVQLLRANGCRVIGLDFDIRKRELAKLFGAEAVDPDREDVVAAAIRFSSGRGVDGVLITAATTSDEPVHQGAQMCRKRGRIVLVGVAGLNLSRADFYEKELSFRVSCSYGPGRYDPAYEDRGHDYPIGFVRWTEQRNFEAVLNLLATRAVTVEPLTTHRYPISDAKRAYLLLDSKKNPYLGIVLQYPEAETRPASSFARTVPMRALSQDKTKVASRQRDSDVSVAFIGAGNYAGRFLMPAFRKAGALFEIVATSGGVSGAHQGQKFGYAKATTDTHAAIASPNANTAVIVTRHDSHAALVRAALEADKHVFVEKPLALTSEDLDAIDATYCACRSRGVATLLMVGFNRRFAPHIRKLKELLSQQQVPKALIMTVNAGSIPPNHWTQDPLIGGGRLVGEACHFVDLLRFLVDAPINGFQISSLIDQTGSVSEDNSSFTLQFEDGSIGTVHYLANGNKAFPKERLEVYCGGRVLQLDNYRVLRGYGWPGFRCMRLLRQDKGQDSCVRDFVDCIRAGAIDGPIPYSELMEVSRIIVKLSEAVRGVRGASPSLAPPARVASV